MGKNSAANIVFVNSGEYFQGAVSGAVASLKISVSDHAQHYLVQLLGHYIASDNFFPTDAGGRPAQTLTEQLAIALEEEKAAQRAQRLRQLGDFSLYVAGFFTHSLSRKLVDVDYYIGMGGAAYGNVAQLEERSGRAHLFKELSQRFPVLVDVLAQISEESGLARGSDKDLLRAYDLWVKTGSERLAKQLAKAGIPAVPKRSGEEDS